MLSVSFANGIRWGARHVNNMVALRLLRLPMISLVFFTGVSLKILFHNWWVCSYKLRAVPCVYNEWLDFDRNLILVVGVFELTNDPLCHFWVDRLFLRSVKWFGIQWLLVSVIYKSVQISRCIAVREKEKDSGLNILKK